MGNFEIYNALDPVKIDRDKRWPVVYLLNNGKKIYIGETTNIGKRLSDHSKDPKKSNLNDRLVIKHNESNKSIAYLLESDLINRAFADETYEIVNSKMQSNEVLNGHDFFGKDKFKEDLKLIWNNLRKLGYFKKDYEEIENEELFKYSPWKEFDSDQLNAINSVKQHIMNDENSFVNGSAGTGKTLVIIRTAMDYILENEDKTIGIFPAKKGNHMTFNRVLKALGPYYKKRIKVIPDLKKARLDKVDYLLVDEAQRLRKWFRGQGSPSYFRTLEKNECPNEIEWLKINNKPYTLYYDFAQSFHKYDLDLKKYIEKNNQYDLKSQYRMKSGEEWISFIKELLQIEEVSNKVYDFEDYDFKIYDDKSSLFNKVREMNDSVGDFDNKSRMVSSLNIKDGKWKTQWTFDNLKNAEIKDYTNIEHEFTFGEFKAVWNKSAHYSDWLEKSDIDEVGCVHTVQGRDFKYVGVLFGDDITFENGRVIATDEIKNSYFILLTRGIFGHGLYIEDNAMRKYVQDFMVTKIKNTN